MQLVYIVKIIRLGSFLKFQRFFISNTLLSLCINHALKVDFFYNMRIEDEKCFNILKKDKLRKNGESVFQTFQMKRKLFLQ